MCLQVCVRMCGLLKISLWILVALFFASILATSVWYMPFKLLRTWNCILMRDQEVIEQPMTVETLPQRLLGEAQHFIKRYVSTVSIHTVPQYNTYQVKNQECLLMLHHN